MKLDFFGSKPTRSYKVGIVTSRFNEPVTSKLYEGAIKYFNDLGSDKLEILDVKVPGAVEIPFACQQLFECGVEGVVALGAVIKGETSHFDYVCNSVESGCTRLQLDYKKPVIFGVLTTENADQAFARSGGEKGNKGAEAASALIEMLNLKEDLLNKHH